MLKVRTLFSGIGSPESALKNIGIEYELVDFCEIDKYAIKSYCAIHNVAENKNLGDVSKVWGRNLPYADLMVWGFPCTDISVAGKRLGILEGNTKSGLYYEGLRILKETKPKYSVIENVKNLAGKQFKGEFEQILEDIKGLGYNNYWKILNAKDFDIPQNRERIFIISIRKDIDTGKFEFPIGIETTKTVADFIDKDNENRYLKQSLRPFLDAKYHTEYKSNNGLKKVFDGNAQGFFNSDFGGKRLYSIHGLCPTLTTKKEMACFVEIASELNGKERLRLSGFSDEDYFKLKGNVPEAQIKKQAGNTIVTNVLSAIFVNLLQVEITQVYEDYKELS
jgi:DNA-cytosine methyltransferase